MSREAMQMVLWALEGWANHDKGYGMSKEREAIKIALAALETSLANWRARFDETTKQEHEPVAKVVSTAHERIWLDLGFDPEVEDEVSFDDLSDATWSHDNATGNGIEYVRADLTRSQVRKWVGLTDEDMEDLFLNEDGVRFARYIEAKLKEKNHG